MSTGTLGRAWERLRLAWASLEGAVEGVRLLWEGELHLLPEPLVTEGDGVRAWTRFRPSGDVVSLLETEESLSPEARALMPPLAVEKFEGLRWVP